MFSCRVRVPSPESTLHSPSLVSTWAINRGGALTPALPSLSPGRFRSTCCCSPSCNSRRLACIREPLFRYSAFLLLYGRYTSGCISCPSAWYTMLGVSGEEIAVGNGSGNRTRESVPCFVNLPTRLCAVVMTVRIKALSCACFAFVLMWMMGSVLFFVFLFWVGFGR